MFHYRNSGEMFGNVLMGLQIESKKYNDFISFLNELKIEYNDETNNKTLNMFNNL